VENANLFSQIKQKTVELEKANKGKDEFFGVISHELRTPLNVTKGYSELVKQKMLGEIIESRINNGYPFKNRFMLWGMFTYETPRQSSILLINSDGEIRHSDF
jgi:signal transduction histidine kinase